MASQIYGILDEKDENELHKDRLLNVEEKPFKRVTKRLLATDAYTNPNLRQPPSPPPDARPEDQDAETQEPEVILFKEDVIMDFVAYDASIVRLQFLANANAAERQRYADDRLRIISEMDVVRDNNRSLRQQLEGAQATLEKRRVFDELADKMTSNRLLRPRDEQAANLAKLAEECEELEEEKSAYGSTWRERKDQFDKLIEEGVTLLKLIRAEQEEAERREAMDENGEEEGETTAVTKCPSGNGTPLPGSYSTPRQDSPSGAGESLKPRPDAGGVIPASGSRPSSLPAGTPQAVSPDANADSQATKHADPSQKQDVEMADPPQSQDVEMADDTQTDTPMGESTAVETPNILVAAPDNSDAMDITYLT